MEMLMLFAFVLLAGLLIMTGVRYGVPCMVSDIYYQMGGRDAYGWVFSLTMGFVALFALRSSGAVDWPSWPWLPTMRTRMLAPCTREEPLLPLSVV